MSGRHACPCCGFLTYPEPPEGDYSICPVCFWEDDPAQSRDPDLAGGANRVSLREAQRNFRECGAVAREFTGRVRKPTAEEIPLRRSQ